MRRIPNHTIILVALLLLSCCCCSAGDFTKTTDYQGVEGTILTKPHQCTNIGCGTNSEDENPSPLKGVRIQAISSETETTQVFTDDTGQFELSLTPGNYDIEIFPPSSPIDKALVNVEIAEKNGIVVQRTYERFFTPWIIEISFLGDTNEDRINEILYQENLKTLGCSYYDDYIFCRLEIEHESHVQEVKSHMESTYIEIYSASMVFIECAA